MKRIFVISLSYKGDRNTKELLDSFLNVDQEGYSLNFVIVDNYPKKPLKVDIKKYKRLNLHVIRSSENIGFAGGNNKGITYALDQGADYILIINNDTVVDKYFIKELLNLAESKSDWGVLAPKIYFQKGYEYHKERYIEKELGRVIWYAGGEIDWSNVAAKHRGVDEVDIGQYGDISETEFASGCAMFFNTEVLKKVGFFDENYFLYYEDTDLSERIRKRGYKIYFCPTSVVWHKNAASSGGSGSDLQDYYITRNRMIFSLKFASLRVKAAIARESIGLLLSGRPWQKKGIKDFYLHRWGRGEIPKD